MFAFRHAAWRPLGDDGSEDDDDDDTDDHEPEQPRGQPWQEQRMQRLTRHRADERDRRADERDRRADDSWTDARRPRPPWASSQELTTRFARMLSLKERRRSDDDMQRTGERAAARSKSCSSEKKLARRRLQQLRRQHRAQMLESVAQIQRRMADMDRARTLADAHVLLWRTNRTAVVVELCRSYFDQFLHGYDSTALDQARRAREFLYTIAEEDMVCREFRGLDKVLSQWEIYTKCHGDMVCRLCKITLVDEEDEVMSVRCQGEVDLQISDATLRNLYPEFHARAQLNAQTRAIADAMIGKRYVLEYEKVLHFNRHGRMFAHETKVHLASGLLAALSDPFAAMQVLQASVMTVDGHWNTREVDYMKIQQEEMYAMPKQML